MQPNTITAELEDTGNFVLKDAATNTILWQSFDTPTDTLLPGQKFSANMSTSLLVSWKAADDWSSGYYQCDWAYINGTDMPQSLALSWTGASITNWNRSSWSSTSVSDRNATVYPYWWFDAYPADYAYLGANGTTFYLGNASGEWGNLTSTSDQGQGALTRMTLDRDGGFRLYSFAAGSTGWVVEGSLLPYPCEVFATCGVFAICSENVTYPTYFSTCTCPMGFVPISVTDPHQGCTAEFQWLDDQYCINDTSSKVELVEVGDIDYPFSDRLSDYLTINETACKQTCMEDCRCAGAVFHRREQMCFLKGTPLFNGGYTVQEGNRSAYLKILTSPLAPSQGAGSMNVRIRLVAGICAAAAAVVLFLCGLMCLIGYRRHVISKAVRRKSSMRFETLGLGPRNFTYKQLNVATRNFSDSELLGRGGMGSVYRGVLRPENVVVAVKRIRDESKKGEQGFLAEATSISQIRHRNLVQLQGWCYEDRNLLLVYDFMSNGSLDQWLYNNTPKAVAAAKAAAGTSSSSSSNKNTKVLSWELRYSILSGVAAALAYLHEECQQCVLHRDIKPSNVMLDEKFEPHLGDFGLARLIDHQKVDKTTMMAGTLGYMAPEMPYTGKATKETDVYSFGILVLEVVCGRHPLEPSNADIPPEDVMLVNKVRRAHEAGKLLSVVDPRIETVSCNVVTTVAATAAHQQHKTRTTTTTTTTLAASSDLEAASHQNMQPELVYNSKTTHCKLADSDHAAAADQYCSSSSSIKDDADSSFSEALNRRKEQTIVNENEQKVRVLQLGLLCSLQKPTARPSMRAVSQILSSSSCTTSTSRDRAAASHETTLMALPPLPPTFSLSHSADLTDISAMLCSIELQTQSYNSQIDGADPVLQIVSDKQPLMSDRSVFSQEYTDSAPAVSPSP
jgi:interleukin-1 receptor-associated kinase 1